MNLKFFLTNDKKTNRQTENCATPSKEPPISAYRYCLLVRLSKKQRYETHLLLLPYKPHGEDMLTISVGILHAKAIVLCHSLYDGKT